MVGATKHRTVADDDRMEAIIAVGCIPCLIDGWYDVFATVQHTTDCGRRFEDEHQHTYGGCTWHHLGTVPEMCCGSVDSATMKFGPSFQHDRRAFADRYGTEAELVQIEDSMVRIYFKEKRAGRYLRGIEWVRLARDLFQEIVAHKPPSSFWTTR